jgi:CDP-paratose 2-epimerase
MKILITGACGFVGSTLAAALSDAGHQIIGIDNFIRPGSELNRLKLVRRGILIVHADLRCADDLSQIPAVDWVIDAAANPAVLAGVDGTSSSRSVFDHNLGSTVNLLEFCKQHRAGFVLLSTSRVYSIPPLSQLPVVVKDNAFVLDRTRGLPIGIDDAGLTEDFSTAAPISLYGASKLASELIALEYGSTFHFPVWINRCGVLAGAGQFGRPDQGIFSFWINAYLRRRPLRYTGFGGSGYQVRDFLHPLDIIPLLQKQWNASADHPRRIYNIGGGANCAMSLRQLSVWCAERFGAHPVASDPAERPFDIPWMVMSSARAIADFGFAPQRSADQILIEIAAHAEQNPHWLEISAK